MLTKNIKFKNFLIKSKIFRIKKILNLLLLENNEILNSLSTKYKYSFSKKIIKKYKKNYNLRIIGMGGSTLGTEAIFDFLKHKIKKNIFFSNNLNNEILKFNKKKI